jgi:hypothetical protein
LGREIFNIEGSEALLKSLYQTRQSELVQTMGKNSAMRKLMALIGEVTIRQGSPEYRNGTAYVGEPEFDPNTVAHELVHAYNDKMYTGLASDGVRNEGVAYAFESLLRAAWSASVMERSLGSSGEFCDAANKGELARAWPAFWAGFGDIAQYPSGIVMLPGQFVPRDRPAQFRLDQDDFRNADRLFGFNLSCSKFADVINGKLSSCCFKVTCDRTSNSPYVISAGVNISSVFR